MYACPKHAAGYIDLGAPNGYEVVKKFHTLYAYWDERDITLLHQDRQRILTEMSLQCEPCGPDLELYQILRR